MIKAAIFDMDGTLADSIGMHFRIWKEILLEQGVEITYDEWRPFIGKIGPVFIEHLNKTRGLDLDGWKLKDYKKKLIDKSYQDEVKIFSGAKELIKELHEKGIKLAVASSEWHDHVIDFLKVNSIDKYFSEVLGLEDIDKPKPEPGVYLKTAERLGINPSECVVFEDSLTGAEAAKRAGMRCVVVETTFSGEEFLHADMVIKDLQDKEKIIEFIDRPVL